MQKSKSLGEFLIESFCKLIDRTFFGDSLLDDIEKEISECEKFINSKESE